MIEADIIKHIRMAFAGIAEPVRVIPFMDSDVPGDRVRDFSGWDSDYAAAYRAFKGKSWTEITLESLYAADFPGEPFDVYNFLTDEAFRYYLPAWLTLAETHAHAAPHILEQLCENLDLSHHSGNECVRQFTARYAPLSLAQKAVIAALLHRAIDTLPPILGTDPATPAYWSYWHQFDTEPSSHPNEI